MNIMDLKKENILIINLLYSSDKYNKFPHLVEKQKKTVYYQAILKSIKKESLKNPLIIQPKNCNGKYKLYIGNNRLTALKELNQTKVPCIIGQFTKEEVKHIKTTTYKTTLSDLK